RLEKEGYAETEANPLYLPRHSIRAVIVLAFLGLALYLYREGRLFQTQALTILGVFFSYVFGIVARIFWAWWTKGRSRAGSTWEDLKAMVVLLVMFYTAGAYLLDRPDYVPKELLNTALGLVLFYFGSR